MKIHKEDLAHLTETEQKIIAKIVDKRLRVESRFPLLMGLIATFGFVCTFSGFAKLIDRVDLFVNNPWILILFGVTVMVVTGAAYRKLN